MVKKEKTCGTCTACCIVLGVEELGKPYSAPCGHLCGQGCGIYRKRPRSCREYQCLWLADHIKGGEEFRPDNLGVLFNYELKNGRLELGVYEIEHGAADKPIVLQLIEERRQNYGIDYVVIYGVGAIVGTNYPIDGKYPDTGEYGVPQPAVPLEDGVCEFWGQFRPSHLMTKDFRKECTMRFTVRRHGEEIEVVFYGVPCITHDNGDVTFELSDEEAMTLCLEMKRVALSED
tara:strand:- start:1164 stop:1859 length:696 start_codon:yes stop_codon:yes gene_type:complete